ncbi:MAG TPA: hypothetical protein VI078_05260 [bacterium]
MRIVAALAVPIGALFLQLAGADVFAAGAATTAAAKAPGSVRLNWITHWKGEDLRERLVHEIRRDFEFLHPEVSVNMVFDADLPGNDPDHKRRAAQAILDMVRTGKIDWDVVYLDVGVYEFVAAQLKDPRWAARHLVDFTGVPGFLSSEEDFIVNDSRYKERMGGIFTGPYTESYFYSLWYNTEVAKKTGVPVKERGMSFDDLVGCARLLQRYNREHGTAITLFKLSAGNRLDCLFEGMFRSQFESFAEGVAPVFTKAKAQALLATLQAFERLAPYQPAVNAGWRDLPIEAWRRDMIVDDDALFMVSGTFMYSHFRGVDVSRAERMHPAESPALGPAKVLVGDYTPQFAVMKDSPHRDVAVEFLMSWATPKNAERWVRYTKNLTGVKGYLSDATSRQVDAFGDVYERFLIDMQQKYRGTPVVNLRSPTYVFGERSPITVVELREKLAQILEGRLTAQQYYEDVLRRVGQPAR